MLTDKCLTASKGELIDFQVRFKAKGFCFYEIYDHVNCNNDQLNIKK